MINVFVSHTGPHDKDEVIDSRPIQPTRPTSSPYYPNYQPNYPPGGNYPQPEYPESNYPQPNYPQPNYPQPNYPTHPDYGTGYPHDRRPDNQPQQYKVAIGDQTKISCEIENSNKRTSWRRQGGLPLPSSSRLSGGDLVCMQFSSVSIQYIHLKNRTMKIWTCCFFLQIIEYTQQDAAGIYECVVHEPHAIYPIVTTELIVVGNYKNLPKNHS